MQPLIPEILAEHLSHLNGELVGINSAIASRSGGNDGIGFAIPINLAKRIMDDLIDDGEVSRGYLGMNFGGEVDQTMALAMGLDNARGIIVGEVVEDGPSDKAGLRESEYNHQPEQRARARLGRISHKNCFL